MEENVDYAGIGGWVPPCAPKINNEAGVQAVRLAERTFRACCPVTLAVAAVEPKIGRGKVYYNCWWNVTYVNREELQPLLDSEAVESFKDAPPMAWIISINKTVIPPNWTVMYQRNVCRCRGLGSHKFDFRF